MAQQSHIKCGAQDLLREVREGVVARDQCELKLMLLRSQVRGRVGQISKVRYNRFKLYEAIFRMGWTETAPALY